MQADTTDQVPEYDTPDEDNPEWTADRMKHAMTYPNFPPDVMRLIDADKKKDKSQKAA